MCDAVHMFDSVVVVVYLLPTYDARVECQHYLSDVRTISIGLIRNQTEQTQTAAHE